MLRQLIWVCPICQVPNDGTPGVKRQICQVGWLPKTDVVYLSRNPSNNKVLPLFINRLLLLWGFHINKINQLAFIDVRILTLIKCKKCCSSIGMAWWIFEVFTCPLIGTVYRNVPKFSDRQVWVNSVDPDQTAPRGAVWSGSTLFAIPSASFGLIALW